MAQCLILSFDFFRKLLKKKQSLRLSFIISDQNTI